MFFLSSLLNLTLKVFNLNNKSVSWVRAKDNHILTVDRETFISGKTENINTHDFCNSSKSSIFFLSRPEILINTPKGENVRYSDAGYTGCHYFFGHMRGQGIGNDLFSIFSWKTRQVTKTKSDKNQNTFCKLSHLI